MNITITITRRNTTPIVVAARGERTSATIHMGGVKHSPLPALDPLHPERVKAHEVSYAGVTYASPAAWFAAWEVTPLSATCEGEPVPLAVVGL